MKFITVDMEDFMDMDKMVSLLREFIYMNRIPFPIKVETIREHADYFAKNKVLVIVSSMALIKI